MAGTVDYVDLMDETGLLSALGAASYDALFTRLGLFVGLRALVACPSLRWVVTPTTGLDHIDAAALTAAGVRVVSLRGETVFLRGVRSTAEHTWALLLALVRKLPAAHRDVLEGGWQREPFLATELQGKCLGLVGIGRIGGMVAAYGTAFRMRVIGFDRDPEVFTAIETRVDSVGIEELLATADVTCLHLPLDEETKGFLSAKRLAGVKPGALLVNTARGELVDETALLDGLESGRIGGAALDVLAGDGVWENRIPANHPLVRFACTHENLILTPHCGGYGRESIVATRRFVTEKFLKASGCHSDRGGTLPLPGGKA
jgi:D-3-phosphoglycerate dehydrogenase